MRKTGVLSCRTGKRGLLGLLILSGLLALPKLLSLLSLPVLSGLLPKGDPADEILQ